MQHPFSLSIEDKHLEGKIVVALGRISEAFRVLLWKEGKELSLSPIQIQFLIFLRFHAAEQCSVSYLAQEFNLTKATVSDSIRVLIQKGLLRKMETTDMRSFRIRLTKEGLQLAGRAAHFALPVEEPLSSFSEGQKEALFTGLIQLIRELNKQGIISIQRMCFTCGHYEQKEGRHYCKLLQQQLLPNELRLDCPEHEGGR
ncbi:MAG: winged helix-turn-helix transcriptional regulator [Bacteroidetes bacterium]|nr:winged helix-turn-helix transcriptional regulator [Bacteroidota bacterium]MBS1628754.1 winged helix-turn-helix transcriptional regulator [Bacteroidota bacterium]